MMFPGSTCRRAHAATEWRRDVAIHNLQFRVIDLGLIGAHLSVELIHCRFLRVDLLLGDAA